MSEGDANAVTPSLAYEVPIQCPGGYASTYPPGSPCMGTGVRAHCSGTRGTGYPSFCAGACVIPATSTPEICDGIDNDCDGLLNENPSVLCDDGRGCTSDSCLGALGCANSAGLSTCQEIRRPITESRIAPDGYTWLMRRDNPRLEGRVFAQVQSQTGTMGNFTRTMSPSAGRVVGYGTTVFEPEVASPGWLWNDNTVGAAGAVGNFRAPRMLLPATGVVDVGLIRHPAASGAAYEEVDWHYMQLAPEVLLVPVRFTTFTSSVVTPSIVAHYQGLARDTLDAASVRTASAVSAGAPAVSVQVQELGAATTPDDLWTQCGIQFRLEDTRVVQNATLADIVAPECGCGGPESSTLNPVLQNNGVRSPLAQYLDQPSVNGAGRDMIDVFVGEIRNVGSGCSETRAIGCGPGCGVFSASTMRTEPGAIRLRGATILETTTWRGDLAHELGHVLGLGHAYEVTPSGVGSVGNSCVPNEWEPTYNAPNLMAARRTTGPLVPNQCARARCVAATYLESFGRLSAARREEICAG